MKRARELVEKSCRFIEDHPDFWEYINELAAHDYARYERMSIKRYMELARYRFKITAPEGEDYGMANAMAPVFTRLLVREHPEYEKCIHTAPSMVDSVFEEVVSALEEVA